MEIILFVLIQLGRNVKQIYMKTKRAALRTVTQVEKYAPFNMRTHPGTC